MSLKGYIVTNVGIVGAVFATSLDSELKALTVVIIAVVSLVANLLWIGQKFRELIVKRLMSDVKDEIVKLKLIQYEPAPRPPGYIPESPLKKKVLGLNLEAKK
jgi:hypothetical protein